MFRHLSNVEKQINIRFLINGGSCEQEFSLFIINEYVLYQILLKSIETKDMANRKPRYQLETREKIGHQHKK